jgi:O-methyltransferase involved in polyketide biosynthesis
MYKMVKENFSMLDVSGTMLITLYARAIESKSKDPIIRDPKAVEMINFLKQEMAGSDHPIHKKISKGTYHPKLGVSMALRSRRFDRYVIDFLNKFPSGTVINLGCGLDTRFDRIDNGRVIWYDMDYPEVIGIRKRFMQENSRRHFIGCSVEDPEWTKKTKTGGPYLIIAEGVFMYLTENIVKELLYRIFSDLGPYELVCEVTNRYWVKKMNTPYMKWKFKRQLGMTGGAVFSFGVPHSRYFEEWNPEYHFLEEWNYFDDHEKKLGWFNWFSGITILRKVQWTVHYRIGNPPSAES